MDEQIPFSAPEESQVEETSNVIPIQGDSEEAQETSAESQPTSPIDQFKNEDGTLDVDKLTESYNQLNNHLSQQNTVLADYKARQQLAEQQAIQQQQYLQQQQAQQQGQQQGRTQWTPEQRNAILDRIKQLRTNQQQQSLQVPQDHQGMLAQSDLELVQQAIRNEIQSQQPNQPLPNIKNEVQEALHEIVQRNSQTLQARQQQETEYKDLTIYNKFENVFNRLAGNDPNMESLLNDIGEEIVNDDGFQNARGKFHQGQDISDQYVEKAIRDAYSRVLQRGQQMLGRFQNPDLQAGLQQRQTAAGLGRGNMNAPPPARQQGASIFDSPEYANLDPQFRQDMKEMFGE